MQLYAAAENNSVARDLFHAFKVDEVARVAQFKAVIFERGIGLLHAAPLVNVLTAQVIYYLVSVGFNIYYVAYQNFFLFGFGRENDRFV